MNAFKFDFEKLIPFNLLDIPAELAFIYSKLDGICLNLKEINLFKAKRFKILDWQEVHVDKNMQILGEEKLNRIKSKIQLPSDINSFSFNKYIQIYIKVIFSFNFGFDF